jgi:hypothetical protein
MKSFIPVVQRSNGALTTSLDEVGVEFVHYYQNLLGTSSSISPIDIVVVHSSPCLDESHSSFLLAPVSNEAIKETLFSFGNDKALGPTDFHLFFSRNLGTSLGLIFVRQFKISFLLLKSTNRLIIALLLWFQSLLMSTQPMILSQFFCCNVIYKVISKILAGRLCRALLDIIGPAQNAFLGGRNMIDNINLA